MRNKILIINFVLLLLWQANAAASNNCFIENKGQWNSEVKYLFKCKNYNAWITNSGVVYDYFEAKNETIKGDVVKISFHNSNSYPAFATSGKLQTKHNYFIGNNPRKWAKNVEIYNEVLVQNIYDGINIRYYIDTLNGMNMRYDFEVLPFANPNLIQLQIEGPNNIAINANNELELHFDSKTYKHTNLLAYQTKPVECKFSKSQHFAQAYGFDIGQYDIAQKLIIDPLIYSIVITGEREERAYAIATDTTGAAYWTGFTYSTHYPTILGSYITIKINDEHSRDVIVSKVDPAGKKLIFSTFLGGFSSEVGRYIKLDELNQIYIVGETNSNDTTANFSRAFPIKAPANATTELTTYKAGNNTFLAKLSPNGDELQMAVLIGSNNDDNSGGLNLIMDYDTLTKTDTLKSIAVVTNISNTPIPIEPVYTSPGAAQDSFAGGETDCYITIIDKTGANIEYATYWGGDGIETPKSVAIDKNKNVYIAANTTSTNITTSNEAVYKGYAGAEDVIVAKFDSTLSTMIYSTYIGGTQLDQVEGIDIDSAGCAYITGSTMSGNYPITQELDNQLKVDTSDIFITKLNATGSAIVYSASIASTNGNHATGIVVDAEQNAHISGYTFSRDFPITWDAFFAESSEYGDALYAVVNSTGDSIIFASYIGGAQNERAYGLALDKISAAYICGTAEGFAEFPHSLMIYDSIFVGFDPETDFPIWDTVYGGNECFVFKSMYKPYPGELETNIHTFGDMFCRGSSLRITIYTPYGFYYPDNIFSVQLSDTNSNFTQYSEVIGTLQAPSGGQVNITFPSNLPASRNYRIRVISSHPRSLGAPNAQPLDISPPYIELDSALFAGICLADSLEIPIHSNSCFNANNIYTLELSDEAGSFATPLVLASQAGNGPMTFKIELPESVKPAIAYKLRCTSSSPNVISNVVNFTIIRPTVTLASAEINALQNRCAGEEIAFNFSATRCFDENSAFYLVLSDTAGNFTATADTLGHTTLGDITGIADIDIPLAISAKIPGNLPFSKNYKIKLISTLPQLEYVLSDNNIAINFALGLPFIFVDNLPGLQICYDDSTNIDLDIHSCFEDNNIFQAFVQAADEWLLVGTSEPQSNELKVFIPSDKAINSNTFIFIQSTNSIVYSDTIPLVISSKEVTITGHTPAELCANDSFALNCAANICVRDSIEMFVEMSVNDSSFASFIQIGTGKILGNNSIINCHLLGSIDYNDVHYVRLTDGKGYYSKHFVLSINPQGLAITTEPADMEVLCSGVTFYIDFTATGCFDIENVFSIVLSDVTGNFASDSAQIVGSITSGNSGRIQVHIPFDILEGNSYKVKIISSHPQVESILDLDITIQNPFILIDSLSNLTQCNPNPVLPKSSAITQADGDPYIRFIASDCFGEDNIFILQFAKDGDFSAPINVDSCAWNEREFNFTLPPGMGTDAYRFRVTATNPNISSNENGFDIRYNQPYAALLGASKPVICRNKDFIFNYNTSECFDEGNVFYLEMSDSNGTFTNPIILDSNLALLAGRFTIKVPESVPYNKSYKLRIRSTAPAGNFVQNQIEFTVRGPEILTGNLYRINIKRNDTLYVPFNCNCLDMEGKVFVAQLSDPYGKFDNILEIGSQVGWEPDGKIYTRISLDASDGNGYRIRVVCKNPAVVGTNNNKDITIFGVIVSGDINEKEAEYMPEVRPLPFYDELIIALPDNTASSEQPSLQSIKSIAVFDLLGRQQMKIEASDLQINSNIIKINTTDLQPGTYILFIETSQKTYQKLIIKSYSSSNS